MEINQDIGDLIYQLFQQDVCMRCILRILKITDINHYRERSLYPEILMKVGELVGHNILEQYDFLRIKRKANIPLFKQPITQVHSTLKEQLVTKPIYVIIDSNNCSICLGILQNIDEKQFIHSLVENIRAKDYEFDSFKFSVRTPIGASIRQLLIVNECVHQLKTQTNLSSIVSTPNYAIDIKAVIKWILCQHLSEQFSVKSDAYDDRFSINLQFENISDDIEQFNPFKLIVEKIEDQLWEEKIHKKLKMNDPQLKAETHNRLLQKKNVALQPFLPTSTNLEKIFKIPNEQLKTMLYINSNYPTKLDITTSYQNIFIKGNYIKLARFISQTPWIIDGHKIYETSIQDLVSEQAVKSFRPSTIKFHSGGREDIDVRMLGNGRPFVLELVDPHRVTKDEALLEQIQLDIHRSNFIRVTKLSFTDISCFGDLKESESNKIKAYCCIVNTKDDVKQELIDKCNSIQDLQVNQKTPLRVLHRRTLMIRQKIIHALKIIRLNENWLQVYVLSSAGTYIKEFIHSDLERTQPSLCDLLESKCDIFQLDVVKLYEKFDEKVLINFKELDKECLSVQNEA